MKLFILTLADYEDDNVIGAYQSLDAARAARDVFMAANPTTYIDNIHCVSLDLGAPASEDRAYEDLDPPELVKARKKAAYDEYVAQYKKELGLE